MKKHLGYKENTKDIEILTPYGYEKFDGINKIEVEKYMVIKFKNHPVIRCSIHHPFIDEHHREIKAKDITYKHRIRSVDGLVKIEYKYIKQEKIELYDIVNSGTDHVYYSNGILSHNCEFSGSDGTLINGRKLEQLTYTDPIKTYDNDNFRVYEDPQEGHIYVLIADTSEGVGEDYSFINVIDVTQMPYRQVFAYSNNLIVPNMFAGVVAQVGKKYNEALLVVESNNSSGGIVLEVLWNDIEYENILVSNIKDSQTVAGYGKRSTPGVRTTAKTKNIGCSYLKDLIETDQLIICDWKTFQELTTFIRKGKSYEAKRGNHDDAVMTLVIFAWFTSQPYFEDVTGIQSGQRLRESMNADIDYSQVFGGIVDGVSDIEEEDFEFLRNVQ